VFAALQSAGVVGLGTTANAVTGGVVGALVYKAVDSEEDH